MRLSMGLGKRAESRTEESTVGKPDRRPSQRASEPVFRGFSTHGVLSGHCGDQDLAISSQRVDLIRIQFQSDQASGNPATHFKIESVDIEASGGAPAHIHGEGAVS